MANAPVDAERVQRWLGNGGMPLLGMIGFAIDRASDGESLGQWTPTPLALNPRGAVQAGLFTVVLDAAISMAILSALPRGKFAVSLDVHTATLEPADAINPLVVMGQVQRLGRSTAFARGSVSRADGRLVAEAHGSYVIRSRGGDTDTAAVAS